MFRLSLALLVEDTRNHSVAFSPGHYVKYGLRFTDEGQPSCGNFGGPRQDQYPWRLRQPLPLTPCWFEYLAISL